MALVLLKPILQRNVVVHESSASEHCIYTLDSIRRHIKRSRNPSNWRFEQYSPGCNVRCRRS